MAPLATALVVTLLVAYLAKYPVRRLRKPLDKAGTTTAGPSTSKQSKKISNFGLQNCNENRDYEEI